MDKPEKAPMRLTIKTNEDCLEIEAPTGTNLADALTDAGLSINFACGGHGSCGCCGVHVRSGSFMLGGNPVVIDGQDTLPSCRIICDEGVAQIDVPASAIVLSRGRILENYNLPSHTFSPTVRIEQEQNGETTTRLLRMLTDKGWRQTPLRDEASAVPLGIAVDIGTTTVAAVMLDLATGNILSRASLYNQQIQKADDVASRISFCRDDEAVEQMRKLIVDDTISVLIDDLCRDAGAASDRVLRIAFSGNTTMMHLLAGLNPTSMGSLPFTPVATQFPTQSASKLGFPVHSEAVADLLPSSAAYIGADIVSDLLVSSLTQGPKPALLVDIGTNGEIVLAADGNLFACATAAGPAFEGAGLSHGCRAAQGAICHICFDDQLDLRIEVIGGGEPLGICGSAVVDFLACGRRSGLLNEFGRFDKDKLEECGRLTEVQTDHG
ncbi:MAG: ATP-binding protein, partial [Deltaproteobacteria bacterium]|nr:ATP-binding protein [Deltaproteobacteria bacterium]